MKRFERNTQNDMANHKDSDHEFTEKRLSALNDAEGFRPNAAQGRNLLQRRLAPQSRRPLFQRWAWGTAAVTMAFFAMLALQAPRAAAMNGDRPAGSLHELMGDVHWFLMAHYNMALKVLHGSSDAAPNFTLADASGKQVTLSDYKGKVVLLNFWATWCQPCKTEIPWFMDMQKAYGDDLVVLGVSMDEDGWSAVRPFIEQRQVNYPMMIASPDLPERYKKIENLPTTFLIGRDGNIVGTHNALANLAGYEEWVKKAF
jgi:peroxiredoxin